MREVRFLAFYCVFIISIAKKMTNILRFGAIVEKLYCGDN